MSKSIVSKDIKFFSLNEKRELHFLLDILPQHYLLSENSIKFTPKKAFLSSTNFGDATNY